MTSLGPFLTTKISLGQWELMSVTLSPTDNASTAQTPTSGSYGVTWTTNNWDGATAVALLTLTLTGDVEDIIPITTVAGTTTAVTTTGVGSIAVFQAKDVSAKTLKYKIYDFAVEGGSGDELAFVATGTAPVGVAFTLSFLVKRTAT